MNDQDKGVCIEIDGIYCPECRDLHPSVRWHDKYIDYINKEEWIKHHKKVLARFGISFTEKDVVKAYYEQIAAYGIKEAEQLDKCVICSSLTNFKNVETGNYVCSDECKYSDNELQKE